MQTLRTRGVILELQKSLLFVETAGEVPEQERYSKDLGLLIFVRGGRDGGRHCLHTQGQAESTLGPSQLADLL